MKYILIISIAIIAIIVFYIAFTQEDFIKLRYSQSKIQELLLKEFPIGTQDEIIISALNKKGIKYNHYKNMGFLKQEPPKDKVVGMQSIRAYLGRYRSFPIPFITASVVAYFGFNEQGKLIDIWVWKTYDSL